MRHLLINPTIREVDGAIFQGGECDSKAMTIRFRSGSVRLVIAHVYIYVGDEDFVLASLILGRLGEDAYHSSNLEMR